MSTSSVFSGSKDTERCSECFHDRPHSQAFHQKAVDRFEAEVVATGKQLDVWLKGINSQLKQR